MAQVTKTFDGKKFHYFLGGNLYRNSTRDFKYACVAITREAKGATSEGYEFIISLGNNSTSTYNSMAKFYGHCDLRIEEIR